jgi:Phosphotransferase enzyme family
LENVMAVHAEDLFPLATPGPAELARLAGAAAGRTVRDPAVRVTPIDYEWGSVATAGLWRADVTDAGSPAATFFVKLVRHTRLWPGLNHMPTEEARAEFISYYPWHYELDIHESAIEAVLPLGLRTPQLHGVVRPDADHMGLWWEFIDQRTEPWELADYRLAARLLGQLAARRRAGAAVNAALPELARTAQDSALRFYTQARVLTGVLPMLRADGVWRHPVLTTALRAAGDPGLPADMLALGERLPWLLDTLDELPQTYAHGDASPQNLLLPAGEPDTIAVIDWGFGTLLPVGFDLGQLLLGLAHAGAADPSQLAAIDAEIFPAYLDGLAAEDYKVDPAQVRTGYIGSMAARSALCAIPVEKLGQPPTEELTQLCADRLRLTRLMLDMAREVLPA